MVVLFFYESSNIQGKGAIPARNLVVLLLVQNHPNEVDTGMPCDNCVAK